MDVLTAWHALIQEGSLEPKLSIGFGTGDVVISKEPALEVRLHPVLNPFGLARQDGVDLNALIKSDPQAGDDKLAEYTALVKKSIQEGIDTEAQGIAYCVFGAVPEECTPMQYGGHYLGLDHELLEGIEIPKVAVLLGESELYFESLSDLPADIIAWDSIRTGITVTKFKEYRAGLFAASDEEAQVSYSAPSVQEILEAIDARVGIHV